MSRKLVKLYVSGIILFQRKIANFYREIGTGVLAASLVS